MSFLNIISCSFLPLEYLTRSYVKLQVNIKKEAESNQKEQLKNTDDDDDDDSTIDELPPDSLITLIQPGTAIGSASLWLAALKIMRF